ncbi:MAG TPA: sulfite exporter TauE/SafE family protein, partial [Verrucomicrobiales bacterium]|nr:sulfite exporter TauE/SafE family protein [Verrucomicrobiales bacterium]
MESWFLLLGISLVAFLYSSVGHAGASGYIAVMAFGSIPAQ